VTERVGITTALERHNTALITQPLACR